MVQVAGREYHVGPPCRQDRALGRQHAPEPLAPAAAPTLHILVPPASVAEVEHGAAVQSYAMISLKPGIVSPRNIVIGQNYFEFYSRGRDLAIPSICQVAGIAQIGCIT